MNGRGGRAAVLALAAAACAAPPGPQPSAAGAAAPASLSPELVEQVRRGPAAVRLEEPSVALPLRGSHELPLLAARLDGAGPFDLLLDLGSNVTLLDDETARASGARLLASRGGRGDIWQVDEVALGGWKLEDVVVGSYEDLDVAGVLGYNALDRLPFTIDYPRMEMRVGPGEGPRSPARAIPFQLVSRMPAVTGTVGGERLELFLDTGASNWLSMPAAMESRLALVAPAVPGPRLWNNQTGETRVRVARLRDDLRVGEVVIRSPLVFFDPDLDAPFLGSPLLAAFALRFDPERRLVELDPAAPGPISVPAYRTAGFTLVRRGGELHVDDVIPGSAAAAAGVAPGVRVLDVAGLGSGATAADLRALARRQDALRITIGRERPRELDVPITVLGAEAGAPQRQETRR